MRNNVIVTDPEIMSGEPVFRGTRVPIQALFDNLEAMSAEDFVKHYPSVRLEQVMEVLRLAAQKTIPKSKRPTYALAS